MKRENGYLILNQENMFYKENQSIGSFWFLVNGKQFMFKACESLYCYVELFYEQVARFLHIPTVHYNLAVCGFMTGVLTETFNPNSLKEVYLKDILEKFYDEVVCLNTKDYPTAYFVENIFNLEDLWSALLYYYRNRKDKNAIVSHLMKQIVDSFLLQICTENIDLHFINLVVLDGENPTLAPNFDYGQCGLVLYDNSTYNLQVSPLSFCDKNNAESTILKFLEISSFEFRERLKEKIHLMPDFQTVYQHIEKNTGVEMNQTIKSVLLSRYQHSKENLLNLLDQFDERRAKKRFP